MKKEHSILSVKDLSVGYQSKKNVMLIASNINFNLNTGELVGLVGANGIGKSTLLRTLTQLQPALSGEIYINNKPLSSYSNSILATQLSLVLTDKSLSKNLSVFELVALGRQPYTNWIGKLTETDVALINTSLEQTHSLELSDKKCYELSDGQLQKVLIARALAQDTPLIILDEPTTHLDMYHKAYILKLLQGIAKTAQKTILFSSHEINLAIQLCDQMLVMTPEKTYFNQPCQLIEQGTFETLFPEEIISFDKISGSFVVKK
ncbi:ABC transporter ATP-binding protein [Aurantibacter aestuarii]|nr:ABC transporter ATP-binding protein [Aurantibacter aestuarii]